MTNLSDEHEIPLPENTGSSGKQELATRSVLPEKPQQGLPFVDAIEKGLAASPRALGEFGSAMLAGAARQLANENQDLKEETGRLRNLLDERRNLLKKERIRKAVLTERVKSELGNRHLRNFGITVGTTLASAGLFRGPSADDGSSWALILGGALLLLLSWFSPIKYGKDSPADGNDS